MAPGLDNVLDKFMPHPQVASGAYFDIAGSVVGCDVHLQPDSDQLSIIIPPWHANEYIQRKLMKRQVALGRSVLSYTLHDDMLTANIDQTIAAFKSIAQRIAEDTTQIDVPNKKFISASLGTAVVPFVLGEYGIKANAVLIAPGGDLATSLWTGIRTTSLRASFENQGISLGDLQHAWQKLSPTYQAVYGIRNCNFTMYISKDDRVVRHETNHQYINELRSSGNTVHEKRNRFLGHYGTIVRRSLVGSL